MLAVFGNLKRLSPFAVDTGIAAICYLAMALLLASRDAPRWTFTAAFLSSAPLIWRRQQPIVVALITGAGTIALGGAGQLHDQPYSQLVATYTFASLSPLAWRIAGVIITAAGVWFSLSLEQKPIVSFGYVITAFIAAYALGISARARREHIALLEERALRHAEEKDAAAARERERIARDMHDIIAHSISVIVVQAEAGPVALRKDPGRAEAMFATISDAGRDALTQLRGTLGVLRGPTGLQPQPDLDALPLLIADSALPARLLEEGDRPPVIPAQIGLTVYRVVQESLTNARRHADASNVDVKLEWQPGALAVEVSDDGVGRVAGPGGHGLTGMRERVAACGGELTAGATGHGWRVLARLPL